MGRAMETHGIDALAGGESFLLSLIFSTFRCMVRFGCLHALTRARLVVGGVYTVCEANETAKLMRAQDHIQYAGFHHSATYDGVTASNFCSGGSA